MKHAVWKESQQSAVFQADLVRRSPNFRKVFWRRRILACASCYAGSLVKKSWAFTCIQKIRSNGLVVGCIPYSHSKSKHVGHQASSLLLMLRYLLNVNSFRHWKWHAMMAASSMKLHVRRSTWKTTRHRRRAFCRLARRRDLQTAQQIMNSQWTKPPRGSPGFFQQRT